MSDETILVVDDNRKVADFMAGSLLPSLGYQTLVAYDGKSALKIVRARQLSLLLLDLQLPDTTGLELLRQLTQEGLSVPTILTTAHGSEDVAVDAFRLGVQDYLIKPVDSDVLNAAITRALTATRLSRETTRLTALLKDQVSWLTGLIKVGQSVTSSLKLDEVLRRIVEAGVHLTRAEEGFLALLDEQSEQLYLRAVKNIDEEKAKNIRIPITDTLVGSVLKSRRPLRISEDSNRPHIKVSTGFLVHSLIHVPLLSKGKPLGVLSVDNHGKKASFSERDETLLTSLADYAAVAIENASLYLQAQQEINERLRVEQALRESEERYSLAVRGANDGLWDWNLKTNQVYYSLRWKSMLGYREDEVGATLDEWLTRVHPEDLERIKLDISTHLKGITSHFENEHRMLHKDGTYRWMLTRGIAIGDQDGVSHRMAGSQSDITDRKYAEQKLLRDAFYDTLTGLPNRALFMDRLKIAIERAKRRKDYLFAVLFMDLDRFKDINDSLGHTVGDELLISTAHMLESGLRATDTVARLGGDEFVILIEDVRDVSVATRVADWIKKRLASPFHLAENDVFISASVGIVLGLPAYQRPEDVLRDADIAMYVAKGNGKARHEIFNPVMRDRIMQRLALESDLRLAIENKELRIFYQPIVSLTDGQLVGFEALVRWQHPNRGLLLPATFIPLAEETGLVISIDRWVLQEAVQQIRRWQMQYPSDPPLTININISSQQLAQPDLIERMKQILQETGLEPSSLRLEITESTILQNNEYTNIIFTELQNLGIEVQIDDFGTGYSSLGYLHQFPVNALKIDRSFIAHLENSSDSSQIVQTVVALAHELGMEAIAEGLETVGQVDRLRAIGCDFGQGYFLCIPLTQDATGELLEKIKTGENRMPPWKLIQPEANAVQGSQT